MDQGILQHQECGSSPPLTSVIVPAYNSLHELSQCLEALGNFRNEHCELIVVDDQSTQNIRDIAVQHGARYFRTPRRGGPALARNLGAQHALGEILLFVDADVVVPREALGIIHECFAENPALAALFGSYDDEPACSDFWSSFKNLLHHHVHQASNTEAVTFWAGCGAIRRRAFEAAGGFDAEKYQAPSIEDIELGSRLIRQQQTIRLVKQLQVKHLKKWTPLALWRTDILQRALPWSRLIVETRSAPANLNLAWKSRASACLVAMLPLLLGGVMLALNRFSIPWVVLSSALLAIDVALLLSLNRELYDFFRRKRSASFAAGAILAHWFYLFYSGTVFLFCWTTEILRAEFRPVTPDVPPGHSRPGSR